MDKDKIKRINFLARKQKSQTPLTQSELAEQKALRDEYRDEFRRSFSSTLEHTYIVDANGNRTRALKEKANGNNE